MAFVVLQEFGQIMPGGGTVDPQQMTQQVSCTAHDAAQSRRDGAVDLSAQNPAQVFQSTGVAFCFSDCLVMTVVLTCS